MNWEQQKFLLIIIVFVLAIILSFLLGASYGVTTDRNQFIGTFLPIFETIGAWISGVGSLCAVFAALWIADEQRKRDKESFKLSFGFALMYPDTEAKLTITATSTGQRPSTINSINIRSSDTNIAFSVTKLAAFSSPLPCKLSYGEQATFIFPNEVEKYIAEYIVDECSGISKNLKVYINTTTEAFACPMSKELLQTFDSHALQLKSLSPIN